MFRDSSTYLQCKIHGRVDGGKREGTVCSKDVAIFFLYLPVKRDSSGNRCRVPPRARSRLSIVEFAVSLF